MKPKRLTPGEMRKVAVEIVCKNPIFLRCMSCKQAWSPNLREGGRLPKGYWKCPNGCNVNSANVETI